VADRKREEGDIMTERLDSDVFAGELMAPIECGPPSLMAELRIKLSPYCMPPPQVQRKSFPEKIFLFVKGIVRH